MSGAWTDYRAALEDGKLDFSVVAKPAKVEIDDPYGTGFGSAIVTYEDVPGAQVNVDNNNRILGCVSSQYGIIQNEQAFSLLEPLTLAGAVITHVGMTEQGLCFMVAQWEMFSATGDDYCLDIMCTNSFNGNYPCGLIMTPRRIICQNMYRKISHDQLFHIRHMSLALKRITEAKVNEHRIIGFIDDFTEIIDHANYCTMSAARYKELLEMLFPYPTNKEAERYQTSKERVDRLRENFGDVYMNASDILKYKGTMLQFIHAYYDYLSHGEPGKNMPGDWNNKRLSALIGGTSVNTKLVKELVK